MKRKFRELNDDTKQRISQALKGRGLTDNHKQAISDGMRAYWATSPISQTMEIMRLKTVLTMKISADKVKLCYTLYENSPLYQLMETPLEIYELPHWDFCLERTEGKYYNYIYKIIYLEQTSNNPNSEYDMKCFGTLRWGLKADKEGEMSGFVWIEIDKSNYTSTTTITPTIALFTSITLRECWD